MQPGPSRIPATAGIPDIDVIVTEPGWRRVLRNPEHVAKGAARAGGAAAVVVLASDAPVRILNIRHRRRNKPTNVLTFDSLGPGIPGEIVLALGTVRREARAAGRRLADHLRHLVIHGSLHLQGHDHHEVGAARRMEMRESVLLRRLGAPNPWKLGRGSTR